MDPAVCQHRVHMALEVQVLEVQVQVALGVQVLVVPEVLEGQVREAPGAQVLVLCTVMVQGMALHQGLMAVRVACMELEDLVMATVR